MFNINRVYFHIITDEKKLEIQLRCLLRKIRVSSALCSINLHRISLVQICLRSCHGDLGISVFCVSLLILH